VTQAAPTISRRLDAVVARRARAGVVYADVWRAVGAEADRLGLARPSYQQVRLLAHEAIERRVRRRAIGGMLVDAAFDPLTKRGLATYGRAAVAAAEELARSRSKGDK
jgi:hypothetical protein